MSTLRTTPPFRALPFAPANDLPPGTVAAVFGAGTRNGPFFLRTASNALHRPTPPLDLRHDLTPPGGIVDLGDINFTGMTLDQGQRTVRTVVAGLPADVAPCVIGDHITTLAVVQALAPRQRFRVVRFGHHLDRATGPLGTTTVMSHVSDVVGAGSLVQVGVASPAHGAGTQVCLSAPEIDDPGSFRRTVGTGDVYLSVDVGVLDRAEMASTARPADVGLSTRHLVRLLDLVLAGNRLVGFDVVGFAADLADRGPDTLADADRATVVFLHLLDWLSRQHAAVSA